MPMYDYKCSKGHTFEAMERMDDRHTSTCRECGESAKMLVSAPRIDPNCDLPGARMVQRKKMEERGRGRDMTSANKTVADEAVVRDAHAARQARGENPIISS